MSTVRAGLAGRSHVALATASQGSDHLLILREDQNQLVSHAKSRVRGTVTSGLAGFRWVPRNCVGAKPGPSGRFCRIVSQSAICSATCGGKKRALGQGVPSQSQNAPMGRFGFDLFTPISAEDLAGVFLIVRRVRPRAPIR